MVPIPVDFIPLVLVTLSFPSCCASELLIRKCCQDWQELNRNNVCVDRLGYHGNKSWPAAARRAVRDVRKTEASVFPWWMSNATLPLNSITLKPVPGFLEGQYDYRYIEYGVMPPCEARLTWRTSSKGKLWKSFHLLHNGSILYHVKEVGKPVLFSPYSYCADMFRYNDSLSSPGYLVCPCLETLCIKKCCKPGHYMSLHVKRHGVESDCKSKLDNGTVWIPRMYYDNLTEIAPPQPYVLFHNAFTCPEDRLRVPIEPENPGGFWRFLNSSVLVKAIGKGIPFEPQFTCGELSVINDNKTLVENLLVCGPRKKAEAPTAKSQYYIILCLVGIFFMVLTLIVFALVPETRKTNTSYIVSHIVVQLPAYLCLALSLFFSVAPPLLCFCFPFIIQFSFLAAFFWLNVMCIDISWAFSGFRPPQGSILERDNKKFIYYSLYAWGSPTIILIVTAIMEFVQEIPDTYLKPDFGVRSCWFKEKAAVFAYFYGPMAVLLLINFALFIFTTIKIIKVENDTRILHKGESGRHKGSSFKKDKKRLILYSKLFCLMGLTWITEIISWLHGSPQYYWYVTDAINLLRAVFMFIIFCCKRKVYRILKQRLLPSLASKNDASQCNETMKSSGSTQNSSLQSLEMANLNKDPKVEKSPKIS